MKGKRLECLAELGVSCPIMKKCRGHHAESDVWSQPDIRSISEKYLSCNKRENIGTLS